MTTNQNQKLIISRTPRKEGLIYEGVLNGGNDKLQVNLSIIRKKWFRFITVISGFKVEFQSSVDSVLAFMRPNTLEIKFLSKDDMPKGRVREASFSKISKAIIEDESGRTLGWIDYGLKKDRFFVPDESEAGFVARLSAKDLPLLLLPSKAHLAERFEFIYDTAPNFDVRLIYAWICRKVLQENTSSGD